MCYTIRLNTARQEMEQISVFDYIISNLHGEINMPVCDVFSLSLLLMKAGKYSVNYMT